MTSYKAQALASRAPDPSERKPRARLQRLRLASACTWVAASLTTTLLAPSAKAQEVAPSAAPTGIEATAAPVEPVPAAPPPALEPPPPVTAPPPPVVVEPPPPPPVVVDAPVAPPAPPPPPTFVITGSFLGRYEVRANYDAIGVSRAPRFVEGDAFFYRARLGLATTPIEISESAKVTLQLTPQAAGVLGTLANTITDAPFGVHEGYLRVATSAVRFDVGRFEMNYGDSLVIGSLDWNEVGRSFDGMRMRVAPEGPTGYYVDLFGTQIDEGRPDLIAPFAGGDHYFMGLYAGLGPAVMTGLDLDLYALTQIWPTAEGIDLAPMDPMNAPSNRESATEATFGARAKQKIAAFDYRAEVGLQVGTRPGAVPPMMAPPAEVNSIDAVAYHLDAEIGASVLEDKLRFGLEGILASGDDPTTTDKSEAWNELYPTAHKFLGLADIFHQGGQKRTNVMSGVLHVTAKPSATLTLQLDGHIFTRPQPIFGQDGFAGAEIDAGITYALGKGLNLKGLYAIFVPNEDMYPQGMMAGMLEEEPAHYLELELRYDLK
jgi:hypothetical protein